MQDEDQNIDKTYLETSIASNEEAWIDYSFKIIIFWVSLIYIIAPTLLHLIVEPRPSTDTISDSSIIQSIVISQLPFIVTLVTLAYFTHTNISISKKLNLKNWQWKYLFIPFLIELLLLPTIGAVTKSVSVITKKLFNTDLPQQIVQELVQQCGTSTLIIISISAVIIAPIIEEIVFRKIIFDFLKLRISPRLALFITCALFASVHMNLLTFPSLFLLALILQKLYTKYDSIYPCIILHMVHNGIGFCILTLMRMN